LRPSLGLLAKFCSLTQDLIANAGLMPLMRDLGLQILTIITRVLERKQTKSNFEYRQDANPQRHQ
ncbi:hypothetical protein LEMLEM_LOCUS18553, partial [Lemmus lemmus]